MLSELVSGGLDELPDPLLAEDAEDVAEPAEDELPLLPHADSAAAATAAAIRGRRGRGFKRDDRGGSFARIRRARAGCRPR
jgi:hypothetical protein